MNFYINPLTTICVLEFRTISGLIYIFTFVNIILSPSDYKFTHASRPSPIISQGRMQTYNRDSLVQIRQQNNSMPTQAVIEACQQLGEDNSGEDNAPLFHSLISCGKRKHRREKMRGRRSGSRKQRRENIYTGNKPAYPKKEILNICVWNAKSVRNKTTEISDLILKRNLNLLIITESWPNLLHPDIS